MKETFTGKGGTMTITLENTDIKIKIETEDGAASSALLRSDKDIERLKNVIEKVVKLREFSKTL